MLNSTPLIFKCVFCINLDSVRVKSELYLVPTFNILTFFNTIFEMNGGK